MTNTIVSREEWLNSRLALLKKEKEFSRQRDELTRQRRELPWVRVDSEYQFTDTRGVHRLDSLFTHHKQLLVYHFMFAENWEEGCSSCSFWADSFNGIDCHLSARDTAFVVVSSANTDSLEQYKKRMHWNFRWLSAPAFNRDFHTSFNQTDRQKGSIYYNYREQPFFMEELPAVSVFIRDDANVYHTYSTYARGLDILNGAYSFIDLTPLGRNEVNGQSWVRRKDEY